MTTRDQSINLADTPRFLDADGGAVWAPSVPSLVIDQTAAQASKPLMLGSSLASSQKISDLH